MLRIPTLAAFVLCLSLTVPALAAGAEPPAADALVEVRGEIRNLFAQARALRDGMAALRQDGGLGSADARDQMATLLAGLEECRHELAALRTERRAIVAARRAQAQATMVAAR